MQTPSVLPFITICSLNSCSQGTGSRQRHHSGQQTVCSPNTDSSHRNVLLNYNTQKHTSRLNCTMMQSGTNGTFTAVHTVWWFHEAHHTIRDRTMGRLICAQKLKSTFVCLARSEMRLFSTVTSHFQLACSLSPN